MSEGSPPHTPQRVARDDDTPPPTPSPNPAFRVRTGRSNNDDDAEAAPGDGGGGGGSIAQLMLIFDEYDGGADGWEDYEAKVKGIIGSVAKWQCGPLREATSAALPDTRRAGFWAVHESTRPVQPRSSPYSPSPSPRRSHVVFSEGKCKRLRVMIRHRTQLEKASKSGVILEPSYMKASKSGVILEPSYLKASKSGVIIEPSYMKASKRTATVPTQL